MGQPLFGVGVVLTLIVVLIFVLPQKPGHHLATGGRGAITTVGKLGVGFSEY
jgi:hypothetical protein